MIVKASAEIKDGTQVWLDGQGSVLDVTFDDQAKFLSQFGLMKLASIEASTVLISTNDYEAMVQSAKDRVEP